MSEKYEFNTSSGDKTEVFQQAARILLSRGFRLIDLDITRPWGFFLSVDESQANKFIDEFYSGVELSDTDASLSLRPKFLGIAPNQKLSWQYHHRRSEVWRTLVGSYDLIISTTDEETAPATIQESEVVNIPKGMRHRGAGLDEWALVAEIWQHTDPEKPSNEEDIIRLQDNYGRN